MSTFEAEPAAETLPGYDHVIYESLDPPKEAEPEIFSGDKTGLDEAAAELTQTRAERNEVVERGFSDPEDYTKPAPGNYRVSAEHAADVLKETREWESRFAQSEADAELAKQIDEIRGEQPQAFKLYEQQNSRATARVGTGSAEGARPTIDGGCPGAEAENYSRSGAIRRGAPGSGSIGRATVPAGRR